MASNVNLAANGEQRVDWRVKVVQPGQATVRMKALSDEESDATQQQFPVYIHGMMKMDSLSGVLRPEQTQAVVPYHVPEERLPWLSRLEVRYSPTLAGAMVDALALYGGLSLQHQRRGARSLPAHRAHASTSCCAWGWI